MLRILSGEFTLQPMRSLEFKPIDLERHASVCLEFERDMERLSSGKTDIADDAPRGARFLEKIAAKLAADAGSCLHFWHDETIVGQLNLGRFFDEPVGYVHMLYLAPNYRGLGWAPLLDDAARQHFLARGFDSARLSVTASNERARRFYRRQNWRELGARADKPALIGLEKIYLSQEK